MTNETAPQDDKPSLDPRDPRGEGDPIREVVDEIMGAIGGAPGNL